MKRLPLLLALIALLLLPACDSGMNEEPEPEPEIEWPEATYTLDIYPGPAPAYNRSAATGESFVRYKTANGWVRVDDPGLPFEVTAMADHARMEIHLEYETIAVRGTVTHKGVTSERVFSLWPYDGAVVWYNP